MRIRNVRHKGLKRLILKGDVSGIPAALTGKIVNMIAFLQDMESADELVSIRTWKAHQLTGKRKGIWSLFVSRNWRLTFAIDGNEIEIIDLDFEDYH